MEQVGLNQLLEAGVHFGHQTRRWNPKMKKYIFTERNGIHIIDLRKTLDRLTLAQQAIREVVLRGDRVLMLCTKRQLRGVVEQEAEACGAFYVTERWLGGMLTNFQTIRKQIRRMKELERGQEENAFEFYTKKERLLLERERTKLSKYFSGVKDMTRLPGALFVVDAKREAIAVREATRLGIPVIAITDTNANPELVDFPIPGNDDAIRSVGLISKAIADCIAASRSEVPDEQLKRVEELEATTYSTETGETKDVESAAQPPRSKKKRRLRPEAISTAGGATPDAPKDSAEVEVVEDVSAEVAAPVEAEPAVEAAKAEPVVEAVEAEVEAVEADDESKAKKDEAAE